MFSGMSLSFTGKGKKPMYSPKYFIPLNDDNDLVEKLDKQFKIIILEHKLGRNSK